ncbi:MULTISPECIES: NAD(P)/FAD-dependent oxidoreductase [Thermoanaerobacter]|uniref:FAD-dependent pyridine nucleotide-disulphide oxidoreductase n=2 Tax=Thermoanaerobacter TaxID=1754 RepID=B0KBB1_THEP3|nr:MULTISPECIES: FAD-dependent oxidoreductase [Thermoanaerobacter]ABY95299.1 FAD-dependent pyridine nucleotide-disulphide oxidoreductase [Thermoanaerobacter pseudethanolicus ATCC 33223]ADV80242.1 FAD-dependent pyridine nucleotide-disulfide oxidoreductase [Thermoanaerobacter brockii subsp. finnii Ako-1]HBW59076.1 NAD(P)/FAD-dependent oxidoreductase [Thermoanaerobacter sp.]
MRIVIIGNSVAMVGAVEAIRKYDTSSEIVVISDETYHVYSRPLISYYLGNLVSENKMIYREKDFYRKNKVETIFGIKVVSIDERKKEVYLENGDSISFDKLLIATGGKPIIPPVEGLNKKNVHTFIKMDDAKKLKEAAKPGSKAVIVGGGLIGFKAAEGLHHLGVDVTIVELADRILSTILDTEGASLVSQSLQNDGIKIITGTTVDKIIGDEYVKGVLLKNGQELEADNLIIAIGVVPNVDVVKNTSISINRGILVDNTMKTSVEDVYAAGDVAEGYDMLVESNRVVPIWPNAYMQGEIAGYNMIGINKSFKGIFPMNSIGYKNTNMITAGITNPQQEEFEIISKIDHNRRSYKKFVVKENRLVGFILINDIDRAGLFTGFIKNETDITPFKKYLLNDDFGFIYLPKELRKAKMLDLEVVR